MAATDTAAAALIEDVVAEVAAEQGAEPHVETARAPLEEQTAETPTLEPELPADIAAILEETPEDEDPDEPEDEEPIAAEFDEPVDTWEEPDSKLRREFAKLQKKASFLEKQNLKVARKDWQGEIEQYFPLAAGQAKDIAANAGSRRDALKQAAQIQSIAKTGAEAVAQHYEANIEKIVQERIEAERQALHQQWGRPIGGPGTVPVASAERAAEAENVNSAPTLQERILRKIQGGQLGPELYISEVSESEE